jgi:Fe2+ or Zn2+ uptake regulation protein
MQQCCIYFFMKNMNNKIIKNIKKEGFRLTKNRKAIVEILSSAKKPLRANQILVKLLKINPKTDRTTVYREVCFLIKNNFAQKTQLIDGKIYYEISNNHHHHLICTECKKVRKIVLGNHLIKKEREICKKENFKFITHALEFYGVCKKCA